MIRLVIALCLLTATAWGQWDTNAWPAWQHPREGETHAWQCYTAVNERCHAINVSAPDAPSFWRSQRGNIIEVKAGLAACYDTAATNAYVYPATTNWAAFFESGGQLTPLARSNVWELARMPTNFLEVTPWRALNGIGPFTNDASVGHAHGWIVTNGGPFYPPGRTNWYTTDYGWDGVTNLVQYMTITRAQVVQGATYPANPFRPLGYKVNYTNWSELFSATAGQYVSNLLTHSIDFTFEMATWRSWYSPFPYPLYNARMQTTTATNVVKTGESAACASEREYAFYWTASTNIPDIGNDGEAHDPPTFEGWEFDSYGFNVTTNYIEIRQALTTAKTGSVTIGSTFTNAFSLTWPALPSEPPEHTAARQTIRGWQIKPADIRYLVHWHFTLP